MDENANYLKSVRNQYEDYPYPPRDPQDEKKRLLQDASSALPQLNHYCYRGQRDFSGYRALVAGSGTGDATIFLAHQLKDLGGHVVSLDLSSASLDLVKRRAEVRGLDNITWVHGSIMDLPTMGMEPFDHINCSGVLHHLADPDAGLAALKSVLKDDGCMGIMLYATYGRTGVYQMQSLLRLLNQGENDITDSLDNTKVMLGALPPGNWYRYGVGLSSDIAEFGDSGIYDLLLHPQDRAYTIPQVYDFVEQAGLHFSQFSDPRYRLMLDPDISIGNPQLLAKIKALPVRDQQALLELFYGTIVKHSFYVSAQADTTAQLDDLDNVAYLHHCPGDAPHVAVAVALEKEQGRPILMKGPGFSFPVFPKQYTQAIFRELDGSRTLREVFSAVRERLGQPDLTDQVLLEDFRPVYINFNTVDRMLLRHSAVG
jgi:SAM-dependent methyltransferase